MSSLGLGCGRALTGAYDTWLRRQRFEAPALQVTFESDAVPSVKAQFGRLEFATETRCGLQFTPGPY